VIKFVSDLRHDGGILRVVPPVSSTNKTERQDVIEILLKVALSTIKKSTLQTGSKIALVFSSCSQKQYFINH
jgi:hypothetical protein